MTKDNRFRRYKYDFWVRLAVAIPAAYMAAQLGGNEGFLKLIFIPVFYIEYGITLLITLLVVQVIYMVTRLLDRHFDWYQRPLWRVPLQVLLGIILPAFVTFLLAASYFAFYDRSIFEYNYDNSNLQFNTALITIFNVYYLVRYLLADRAYYHQLSLQQTASYPQLSEVSIMDDTENGPEIFIAHTPTRSVPVPVADIAYFYRSGGHVYLRGFSGKDLLLSQSLDAIEPQLDDQLFFRVARHLIAQRRAIVRHEKLSTGKYMLTLEPGFREEVTVSKPLARNFKSWMNA